LVSNNYSKAQREAVEHGEGPLMVLAGPGSGKTFVITHRIKYLIENKGVKPSNILVVTFSRAAAEEMGERFGKLAPDARGVSFGTFHSVFFGLLKLAYGYRAEHIAKESDRYKILEDIASKLPELKLDMQSSAEGLLAEISSVKQERTDIDFFYSKLCSAELFRQIYKKYEEEMGVRQKIDFDDMLLMTYDLLSEREDIRKACQEKYKYILVDEFQDINSLQYMTVNLLVGKAGNLTIVGDDDQSIYSFRGARPDIMLNFNKDYKNCKTVVLDINFRSTRQIVEAAKRLIRHNKIRFDKKINAERGEGREVEILKFKSSSAQVSTVISDIRSFLSMGYAYEDIAVLYRTNIQPIRVTERFLKLGIPFVLKDNIPNIYDHWIAKDIIAYLKLSKGIGSRADLVRICNKPNRYIKREALYEVSEKGISGLYAYYSDTPYMLEKIKELEHCLKLIASMELKKAVAFIRKGIGYDNYIEDYCDYNGIEESDEFLDILDEIYKSSTDYDSLNDWLVHIDEYKEKLEKIKKNKEDETGVRLMTFHASKGLEFKIVYIIDANKGICPYKKAKSKEDLEEERRMFYVAMTRARDMLFICSSADGKNSRGDISEFIKEIVKK
jgi:uvrD/REP helicase